MMIKFNNVSKRLGKFSIKNVSFELPKGYIMGLIGVNGAGKTSILNLILGAYKPDEGQIVVDGMNYSENEKEIKDMIGFVLVEDMFDGGLTLVQNADYYGKYYSKYDVNVLKEYLTRFHLDEKSKYKTLSKGEKIKFAFAFAMAHDPKLLVLDEPTGNFDPEFRKEFFNILREFMEDGTKSIILATHLTSDLDRIGDYITYIDDGSLILSDDIESVRTKYKIVSAESYKIKLLGEAVIHIEETQYQTRALVKVHGYRKFDDSYKVSDPSIEELMYFITKGNM